MADSSVTRRTRNDPRKEATRIAIIETAETLFAENSIEGVSLRQISSAIGSANTSVVAYHFGSKEGLVEAIFHYRLPGIEARRRELVDEATEAGAENSVFHLLRALWLPLYEQVNSEGMHSYARFMTALTQSTMGDIRIALNSDYPVATELGERLKKAMPKPLRKQFDSRVLMITLLVTGALRMIDSTQPGPKGLALFEDTLRMTSAALLAPLNDQEAD